jgi:hypothetical protein
MTLFNGLVGKTLDAYTTIVLTALIGYVFYLDQKRFETLYNSKISLYREMLCEIMYVYKLPVIFLKNDGNVLDFEDIKASLNNASSRLNMLLVSNKESYAALSRLDKEVQEQLFSLTLLLVKLNQVGAHVNRKVTDSDFYRLLDKSGFSLRSNMAIDFADSANSVDFAVKAFSEKLQMYLQVVFALKAFNDLVIGLVNEMRKDLEIGHFSDDELQKIENEFKDSISGSFDFIGKLMKQVANNGGVDLDI